MRPGYVTLILTLLAPLLAACAIPIPDLAQPNMPNPASVYCYDRGFQLEVRTDANGNQVGVCVFTDGSECEEWAFYRGECKPHGENVLGMPNPASQYCEEQGYTLEIRTDAGGAEYGVCVFPDGSECEEWAYYLGECQPEHTRQ